VAHNFLALRQNFFHLLMRGICVFLSLKGKARDKTVVVLADKKPEPPFKSYWIIDLGHGASSVFCGTQCDSTVTALASDKGGAADMKRVARPVTPSFLAMLRLLLFRQKRRFFRTEA
jgi:hypothetical protein